MSETVDIQAELDKQSTDALMVQMRRAVKLLGKEIGQAVQFGAWAVSQALGTSTRLAKKRRAIKIVAQSLRRKSVFVEMENRASEPRQFWVKNAEEAKSWLGRIIQKRGLAKGSWGWAQRGLGSSSGAFGGVTVLAKRRAYNASAVTKDVKSETDPYVKIVNRLGYVEEAMQNGPRSVSDALDRAARRMVHVIDSKVAKQMGVA